MSYDFPHINSRLVDSARQCDHGGNFSPGAILQDLLSNRHETLIEAMSEGLLLSPLTAVTHFDSTKHRFDIARESPALGSQLGIDRDLPRRDIEAAVGTDEMSRRGRSRSIPSCEPRAGLSRAISNRCFVESKWVTAVRGPKRRPSDIASMRAS